jgi:hypothetical protein
MPVLAACALMQVIAPAHAQDIEPRAYSNAPVGVNFLIAGYAYTRGGLAFDSSLPLTNPNLRTSSAVVSYATVLDLWGKSAKFDVIAPYTWLSGSADYKGEPVERIVDGLSNPAFRLSVNLYGAPALTLKEFADWEQDVIVGVSLRVSPPLGQYDESRLVNIGTNRWSFKPEVGVSKAVGPWTLEIAAAAMFFTDNDEFFGGTTREQEPLYAAQAHVVRSFPSGLWLSAGVAYGAAGETALGGNGLGDDRRNLLYGASVGLPIGGSQSVRLGYIRGETFADVGMDSHSLLLSWALRL